MSVGSSRALFLIFALISLLSHTVLAVIFCFCCIEMGQEKADSQSHKVGSTGVCLRRFSPCLKSILLNRSHVFGFKQLCLSPLSGLFGGLCLIYFGFLFWEPYVCLYYRYIIQCVVVVMLQEIVTHTLHKKYRDCVCFSHEQSGKMMLLLGSSNTQCCGVNNHFFRFDNCGYRCISRS